MSTGKDAKKLCLLTGASGFVGRHLLRALVAEGWRVRVVLRTDSQLDAFGEVGVDFAIESIWRSRDIFQEDTQWWSMACAGVDAVLHAAWYVDPADYLRSPKNLACLAGTMSLAMGAASAKVARFIGLGTCFEYRLSEADLSITTPLDPQTVYAAAKAATYLALHQYFLQSKTDFLWCRLFYLFGEGEDERRLVPYVRKQLSAGDVAQLSSGTQVRDFLDVREAANKIVAYTVAQGEIGAKNICSGLPVTVREIAEKIADECGRRDLLSFDPARDRPSDPRRVVGAQEGGDR